MNKSIIVTGCTQGIGLAICNYFAQEGFSIAGCARNIDAIHQMSSLFKDSYPDQVFHFAACDVTDKQQIKQFAEEAMGAIGVPDILVNNAGAYLPGALIEESDDQLPKMIEVNLYSAYNISKQVVPLMVSRKSGHVFNMCSIASLDAYPNGGSYSISKFALLGFSKQLRLELQPHQVKVTAVMPGAVKTPSWDGVDLPDSRFIPASDIAAVIYNTYKLSAHTNVDEIIIRPQDGDI